MTTTNPDRVYAHWKSMKYGSSRGWGRRRRWFTNDDWLLLARVHKAPVRVVKDIVLEKRGAERPQPRLMGNWEDL